MSAPDPQEIRARLIGPGGAFEIVREDVRGHSMWVFRERVRSLSALLEGTARFGDRTYLVEGDVRLSFAEHRELVVRVAEALARDHGIRPGDRVALFAANRWEWVVAFWAISWLGAVPCLMNGFWTEEEFADAVALVEPALVLLDAPRQARVKAVLGGVRTLEFEREFGALCGTPGAGASAAPGASGARGASAAREESIESARAICPGPVVAEDDPAFLIFTSGTTGRAKAVVVPHRAVCGFSQVSAFAEAYGRGVFGLPLPEAGRPAPPVDDVVLVTSPLFHVSMLYGAIVMGVVKGFAMVILPGRFDPARVLETIARERVTLWMALGSAAPRTAALARTADYDTSSLRQLGIGGAPVSPAVQAALRAAFPSASRTIGMGYTSTEAGAVIASIGGPEFERRPTSTGRISLTVEVELRGEDGKPVANGEAGEVHVRSPYIMLGYWNDREATAKALRRDGWLAMGDVARFDGDLLFIDSRARDMILVSAENVSPTEVEYCLEAHPDVREAAVVAVDDPLTGDAVCAVVVFGPRTAEGASSMPEVAELEAWCRRSLAHYKVPTVWFRTEEALPRTPSGKIVKPQVRAWVAEQQGRVE